jgi:uncharacterized protein
VSRADRIVRLLRLVPHPEGGWYRETFRDANKGRAHSTAIYFLLKRGEISQVHRIDAVEIWHWYAGAPLELSIARGGRTIKHILGSDLAKKQKPQIAVPARAWQGARTLGDYTLMGCTVAPGFEFSKFELKAKARPEASKARGRSRARKRGLRNPHPD